MTRKGETFLTFDVTEKSRSFFGSRNNPTARQKTSLWLLPLRVNSANEIAVASTTAPLNVLCDKSVQSYILCVCVFELAYLVELLGALQLVVALWHRLVQSGLHVLQLQHAV